MRRLGFVLGLLVAGGCSDDGHTMVVEVLTDLTPGVDFVTVRATSSAPTVSEITIPAELGSDFLMPVRLAEVDGLEAGSYELVVTAAAVDGAPVVSRTVRIDLREDIAVTVALSRSCADVTCPGPGAPPSHTTCAAGRCVDPACSELTPDRCEPGDCTTADDCSAPSACAVPLCVEGGCFFGADSTRCGPGESCAPTEGCVGSGPTDGGVDTGVDAADSAPPLDTGVDAADTAVDAPPCALEAMLASTAVIVSDGRFGGTWPELAVVFGADGGFVEIGDDDHLLSGASGVTDFRAGDDPDFERVVQRFESGASTRAMAGVFVAPGGGTLSGADLTGSLVGTTITMVRRDLSALTFGPDGEGGTDYSATHRWELWGCPP